MTLVTDILLGFIYVVAGFAVVCGIAIEIRTRRMLRSDRLSWSQLRWQDGSYIDPAREALPGDAGRGEPGRSAHGALVLFRRPRQPGDGT
jgi:hypothetical protein